MRLIPLFLSACTALSAQWRGEAQFQVHQLSLRAYTLGAPAVSGALEPGPRTGVGLQVGAVHPLQASWSWDLVLGFRPGSRKALPYTNTAGGAGDLDVDLVLGPTLSLGAGARRAWDRFELRGGLALRQEKASLESQDLASEGTALRPWAEVQAGARWGRVGAGVCLAVALAGRDAGGADYAEDLQLLNRGGKAALSHLPTRELGGYVRFTW